MRVVVLGGSGFIGRFVVPQLHHGGHEVGVFHRGTSPADLPSAVRRLLGDRARLTGHATELRELAPDVVIDMIPSSGGSTRSLIQVFRGVARRTVVVSSMDVYRATAVLHRLDHGPLEPIPLTEMSPLRTCQPRQPGR